MAKHNFYNAIWHVKCIRDGKEVWNFSKRNGLADEGEESMLEIVFRKTAAYTPNQFYIRLCNDNLIETDTLSMIQNEMSGNGYAAQIVETSSVGFPTKDTYQGDYRLTSKEVTFTASGGDIGPIITAYLATTSDNTGKLFAYLELPLTRTILNGDSMVVQMAIILQ